MWEKSDAIPFVIINIFISNCNLITHLFLVTVTNYNYFYFVIKLRNSVTFNYYSPTLYIYCYNVFYWAEPFSWIFLQHNTTR